MLRNLLSHTSWFLITNPSKDFFFILGFVKILYRGHVEFEYTLNAEVNILRVEL